MCPAEPAGRVLEAYGNVRPRGMTVIARKRRNRIRLIGALPLYCEHIFADRISESATVILHKTLELPSDDRATLVEGLIASLDRPDH